MPYFTVGHSTRSADEMVALLLAHGIEVVADVRRFPASRRHPHFAREALASTLEAGGIRYAWISELGGRRSRRIGSPHTAWRVAGFAGYADHMDSAEFAEGIGRLLAIGANVRLALLCAEAVPEQCHRRLIADWLCAHGHPVEHIVGLERRRAHSLPPFARVEEGRVIYDGGQASLLPEG